MATGNPILSVRAEAVPVRIDAHQLGPQNFRIHFARGIGWAPKQYRTLAEVTKALLAMRSYTVAEARMCKAICKPAP